MVERSAELIEEFRQAVSGCDEDIDLAYAGALIAKIQYPDLDVGPVVGNVAAMAARAGVRLRHASDDRERVQVLLDEVLRLANLHGADTESPEAYYDPRNSFLNDIFERKIGIPIALAAILMSVGTRVGLALAGTSMPMHFLVRVLGTPEPLFIDCYEGGKLLTETDCRQRLHKTSSGRLYLTRPMLEVISNAAVLTRMLNNLKMIYSGKSNFKRTIDVLDRLIIVNPDQSRLRCERGLVHYRLGDTARAQRDLEAYLCSEPEPKEVSHIRELLRRIS